MREKMMENVRGSDKIYQAWKDGEGQKSPPIPVFPLQLLQR